MKSYILLPGTIFFFYFWFLPVTSEINDLHGFSPQSDSRVFPYPALNYGQYNSPITQKDMSQDDFPYGREHSGYTREVTLKQGKLKGVVRSLKNPKLGQVEVFLGIPYAAPPVGSLRFMPPGSPPNWRGVRIFDNFGPVCPQIPPDLSNEPLRKLNQRRYNTLKILLPFLTNQSEDCLYLNIYSPANGGQRSRKLPVIVYIHGESFDWNSGNPYDGSILSSYGGVIFVTVNFRLGILGFLRPGISDMTISNFGLLDQIAALQWVKDNIAEFGGDPGSVTLMGHGTGAACINFLMVSPVSTASEGLFRRAILMSGTALSDWALTLKPFQVTIQVAEALNCPMTDDKLASCLRKKRLADIMSVNVSVPEFETPFGPIVDGSVIPNTPDKLMGVYSSLFSRYELLHGMTEIESYHSLNVVSLTYGLLERERQQLLWQYMRARYEQMPDLALATTLSEYTNWRRALEHGRLGSMPLGDADEHRDTVLDILSDARVTAPMVQMADYHAKANPKSYLYVFKHNSQFGEFAQMGRSIAGEELAYAFGVPFSGGGVALAHHTFSIPEKLLSEVMLTYFTNFAKTGNPNAPHKTEYLTLGPRDWLQYDKDWPEYEPKNQSFLSIGLHMYIGHFYRHAMTQFWNKILPNRLANPPTGGPRKIFETVPLQQSPKRILDSNKPLNRPEISFGQPVEPPIRDRPTSTVYGVVKPAYLDPSEEDTKGVKTNPMDGPENHGQLSPTTRPEPSASSSMALTLFSIIGICFLIINIFAFTLLYYKKKRVQLEQMRIHQLEDDLDDGGFGERERLRGCGAHIYDIVTGSRRGGRSDTYEAVRLSRKCSAATIDPHTKVREWIIEKCSPAFLRRGRRVYNEESQSELFDDIFEPKLENQQSTQSEPKKPKKNVEKVSVEVDATPGARSASVLKQTPIELTKSLDRGLLTQQLLETPRENPPLRRSKTSVSLTLVTPNDDAQKLSYSSTDMHSSDINVTSRDSEILLRPEALAGDTLENIKKRNFPKVLPDYPDKRLSLPQGKGKTGPPPPPRISTLDRRHTQNTSFDSSTKSSEVPLVSNVIPSEQINLQEVRRIPKTIIAAHKSKPITRKEPIIVIPPTIGPSQILKSTPHINLQETNLNRGSTLKSALKIQLQQPNQSIPPEPSFIPDSKGPSDKVVPSNSKKKDPEVKGSGKGKLDSQENIKSLVRTNAVDDNSFSSSSSSSIAKQSTGTVKKGKPRKM